MNRSNTWTAFIPIFVLVASPLYAVDTHSEGSMTQRFTPKDNGFSFDFDFSWRIMGPAHGSPAPTSVIGRGLRGMDYDIAVTLSPRRVETESVLIDGSRYARNQLGDAFDKIELWAVKVTATLQAGGPGGPTWPLMFQAGPVIMEANFNRESKFWISLRTMGGSITDVEVYDLMITKGLEIIDVSIQDVRWNGIELARNEIRRQQRQTEAAQKYLAQAQTKMESGWYDEAIADAERAVAADRSVQPQASAIVQDATSRKAQQKTTTASTNAASTSSAGNARSSMSSTSPGASSGTVRVPPPPTPQLDQIRRYEQAAVDMQRQMDAMNAAFDELNKGFEKISRSIDRDRRWAAATNLETDGQSPEELIRQVQEKRRELEQQTAERRSDFNQEMDKLEQDLLEQNQQTGTTLALTSLTRIAVTAAIEKARSNAEKELQEQLTEAFREIQEGILEDIEQNISAAERGQAQTLFPEEYEYFGKVIDYFESYQGRVKGSFSTRDTDWLSPSGSQPRKPTLAARPTFTQASLAAFIKQKHELAMSRSEYADEALTSLDLITAWGINEYPSRPEAYYYRSTITADALQRYLLSYRASELGTDTRYSRQARSDLQNLTQQFFLAIDKYDSAMLRRVWDSGLVPTLLHSSGENAYLYATHHNTRSLDLLISLQSPDERSAHIQSLLDVSAGEGNAEAVSVLMARGAKSNERDNRTGMTPIQIAAASGHANIVELFANRYKVDAGAAFDDANTRNLTSARYYLGAYLAGAALQGDEPSGLERVVRYSPTVFHAAYRDGTSYLGYAVAANKTRVLLYLLHNGLSPDARDSGGKPLLVVAMEHNSSDATVQALIDEGASLTTTDAGWHTALHWAAARQRVTLTSYLLDRDAPLDVQDTDGYTPLMAAVLGGNDKIIRMILSHSPDVSIIDAVGRSALHHAVTTTNDETFSLLLDADATVDHFDANGASALHIAIAAGEEGKSRLLLERRPEINARDEKGKTYLYLAVEHIPVLVDTILAMSPNVNAADVAGETPLHRAVETGSTQSVYQLLRAGGDAAAINVAGETPALIAIRSGNAVWPSLTESPQAVRIADGNGNTPVHLLFERSWGMALPLISRYGLDPNQQNSQGWTYLHLAARNNDSHAVAALLDMGADPNLTDTAGDSPLHLAAVHDALEVIVLLLEAGSDKDEKNGAGETAADIARTAGYGQCADYLRTYRRSGKPTR
jgi:ankyrin repeat protein